MRPLAVLVLLCLASPAPAAEPFLLQPGDTVLFLGDSNTYAGGFIARIDAALRARHPDKKYTLVNLGLPSETCSGLTEKDHPFPRPDVHERAARALAEIKPSVVVICYGMNDGIYHSFGEERFQAYQAGIRKLIEKVRAAKARPIVLTPPPFDPVPIRDKVRPADADDFSYRFPFVEYDGVLRRYSDWLVGLRDKDLPVVDVHAAVTKFLAARRKTEPGFTLARDGIHPNDLGHTIIALALLEGWGLPVAATEIKLAPDKPAAERTVPPALPGFTPVWLKADAPEGTRYEVVVDGTVIGTHNAAELAAGVDLTPNPKFAPAQRGGELLEAVRKQHAVLDLALLTAIGHKRPQTPKGIALDEARRQAADLEKTIQKLATPTTFTLALRRVEPKPGPLPVGHRGLYRHAPENTLPAFAACLELRLGIELDVRRTRDGVLVVLHDADVNRTTDGVGAVAGRTLAELRTLDAGAWFDPAFRDTRVPTFEEVLVLVARYKESRALVAVDVKVHDDRIAAEMVALARKLGVLDRLVFIGQTIESPELRRQLRAAAAEAAPARLVPTPEALAEGLRDESAAWLYLRWLPSAEQVAAIHKTGRRVFVAGPLVAGQEPENWQKLAAVGVDAVLTDYPQEARQAFRGH